MKKKICSITTISTSMEIFILPEAIALNKDGWDTVIVTNVTDDLKKKIPENIRYYSVPMERSYNIFLAIKCIYLLYKIFRKEKFDIVQYGTTNASMFASIAAFIARVPKRIYLQWGIMGYDECRGVKRFLLKSVETFLCRISTMVRGVSHKNVAVAVHDGLVKEDKIRCVGAGGTVGVVMDDYDIAQKRSYRTEIRSQYHIEDSKFVYGFVSRICRAKGVVELLTAYKKIAEQKEAVLMIIGPIDTSENVELLEWAKSSDQIIFTGGISHREIVKYFSAIDVLVHPTYREGFGMVLQEAMAMGTPAITTDVPGPSEVIEDGVTGELVRVKDSESLYAAMCSAILDPKKWEEYGRKGRERVEKHFSREVRLKLLVEDKRNIIGIK